MHLNKIVSNVFTIKLSINFVSKGKDTHQLEFKISALKGKTLPSGYELVSSTKDYKRYWTPEIKEVLLSYLISIIIDNLFFSFNSISFLIFRKLIPLFCLLKFIY